MDKLINSLASKTSKQLRTLRNNLNNRISSLKGENTGLKKAKELQKSHALYELSQQECEELLILTLREIKVKK